MLICRGQQGTTNGAAPRTAWLFRMWGEALTKEGGGVDFDIVTELGFPDRAAFLAWRAQLSGLGAGEQVAADEARFLDRSRTRA
jgi:EthD domain